MKLVIMFACLVLYSAMATPFYEVTDQEESPFNDALYKKNFPSGNVIQYEQESNTDQDMGQDDKEGQPAAVVQYNPRGDYIILPNPCNFSQKALKLLGQEKQLFCKI